MSRTLVRALCLPLLLVLAACATPQQIAPGTPESEVVARLGRPNAVYDLPEGGKRLEYGDRSLMQEAWMVDLDPAGRVTQVRQVHSVEVFSRLRVGKDTKEVVLRELGQPWEIQYYRLSGLTAWMYPYKEDGIWNSMMAINFDDRGILHSTQNGPDPRFLGGDRRSD
jgi:hypothetical protein